MKSKLIRWICLVSVAVLSLSSCNMGGGKDAGTHTHTFANTWTSDETHHWHSATCEHGENKDAYAAHTDEDEDGLCNVCQYEVGHNHTFAETWSSDEENHWKDAICTHTDEKGELDKHADEDIDGTCDVCGAHVHTINQFGFCSLCDAETKPVEENVLGSVVYATAARKKNVVGGSIDYKFAGVNRTESLAADKEVINRMEHAVDFSLGTNGTYMKRSYTNAEGKAETQEDWIKALPNGDATGVTVFKVENVVTDAQPSSFDAESLFGYYYVVSTLADGYGAEAVLKSLYEQSQVEENVLDFKQTYDEENNKYTFDFKTLIVHATNIVIGDKKGETVYNVNYYEVSVSFAYADNYALTSLDIECACYTNDPGADRDGDILEEDVDLDYDPVTKAFALRETAAADTYTVSVTQTVGEREEIALEDGSQYGPTDFDIKKVVQRDDRFNVLEIGEEVGESITLAAGEFVELIMLPTPENSFMSFMEQGLTHTVTTKDGTPVRGLVTFAGAKYINIRGDLVGEFVVTLTYRDLVKTFDLIVEGEELGGANRFSYTSTDNNVWNQVYEFKATKTGTYTFYLPYGVGIATFTNVDSYDYPIIEDKNIKFDYQLSSSNEGKFSFQIVLREGQTQKFCFKFRSKNAVYTIGYDEPAE